MGVGSGRVSDREVKGDMIADPIDRRRDVTPEAIESIRDPIPEVTDVAFGSVGAPGAVVSGGGVIVGSGGLSSSTVAPTSAARATIVVPIVAADAAIVEPILTACDAIFESMALVVSGDNVLVDDGVPDLDTICNTEAIGLGSKPVTAGVAPRAIAGVIPRAAGAIGGIVGEGCDGIVPGAAGGLSSEGVGGTVCGGWIGVGGTCDMGCPGRVVPESLEETSWNLLGKGS